MIPESVFTTTDLEYIKSKLPGVLETIKGNLREFEGSPLPLPIAGACYKAIWMEHNQDWFFRPTLRRSCYVRYCRKELCTNGS